MAEPWQCFEQKIVEIGENIVAALLDSNAKLQNITQELHGINDSLARIASIQERMHRPQQIKFTVGTPTNEV